jgi:hypothetical protein
MFGNYKKTYRRDNYYIIFFGYSQKINKIIEIELIKLEKKN